MRQKQHQGSQLPPRTWKFGQNDSAFWSYWSEGFIQGETSVINSFKHHLLNAAYVRYRLGTEEWHPKIQRELMHKTNCCTLKETFQSAPQMWTRKSHGLFSVSTWGWRGVCQPFNSVCLVKRVTGRGNSSCPGTEAGVLCKKKKSLWTHHRSV